MSFVMRKSLVRLTVMSQSRSHVRLLHLVLVRLMH